MRVGETVMVLEVNVTPEDGLDRRRNPWQMPVPGPMMVDTITRLLHYEAIWSVRQFRSFARLLEMQVLARVHAWRPTDIECMVEQLICEGVIE